MSDSPNVGCPQCDGRLESKPRQREYECTRCGRRLHQVVIEEIDLYKDVAGGDGPLAPVAKAALEGVKPDD